MKRSELNQLMRDAVGFMKDMNFSLPPFATWSQTEWDSKSEEYQEILDHMLGWDITDFGYGDYRNIGLLIFTIRNGLFSDIEHTKPYAEKIMIVKEGQTTPYHFHWKKTEDIINRGGGNLIIKMYNSTIVEQLDHLSPVNFNCDGRSYKKPAGTELCLRPGESICIKHGQYHSFWGEVGTGTVLVGEVSCTNDDNIDNRFLEPTGRFPEIDEDEEPLYPLFSEIRLRGKQ